MSFAQRILLSYLAHMLHHLAQHESETKMSALALAIVLAPTLISGPSPLEDAQLCLEAGRTLPAAMLRAAGKPVDEGAGEGTVVGDVDT